MNKKKNIKIDKNKEKKERFSLYHRLIILSIFIALIFILLIVRLRLYSIHKRK